MKRVPKRSADAVRTQPRRWRRTRLDELSSKAAEMLRGRRLSPDTLDILGKLAPTRQIAVVKSMQSSANYSIAFARVFLAATAGEDLATPKRTPRIKDVSSTQMGQMARAIEARRSRFEAAEDSYGDDVLHLVFASGFVSRLISNKKVESYLSTNHPGVLAELKSIVSSTSLDQHL